VRALTTQRGGNQQERDVEVQQRAVARGVALPQVDGGGGDGACKNHGVAHRDGPLAGDPECMYARAWGLEFGA